MKKKILLILSLSLVLAACSPKKTANGSTAKPQKPQVVENKKDENESTKQKEDSKISESKKDGKNESKDSTKQEKVVRKNHIGIEKNSFKASEIKLMMDGDKKLGRKMAFLTFDDGPNTSITPGVLDVLKEKGVKGTFFVVGKYIDSSTAKVLKRAYDEGHAIATHTYSHDYDVLYPGGDADVETILNEQKQSLEILREHLGKDFNTGVFRYPGGHMSWNRAAIKKADEALRNIGAEWIDWNTMNGDAQPTNMPEHDISRPNNVDEVIKNFEKSRTFIPTDEVIVVLMHDTVGKDLTLEALPDLIDHIKSEGYEFGVIE